MPTQKPRLTITLQPKTHAVLKVLSDKNGQSMASLINEVLDGFVPAFEFVLDAVEALEQAEDSKREQIKAQLEAAEGAMTPMLELMLNRADDALSEAKVTADLHPKNPSTKQQENPRDADDERHPSQRPQA
jgi:hypothetical protein